MKKKTLVLISLICLCFLLNCNKNNEIKNKNIIVKQKEETNLKNENQISDPAFDKFWAQFRIFCLNGKYKELIGFVDLPLTTRGPMDYHPKIKFKKNDFPKVFSLFLLQPTGMGINLEETILDDIQENEKIYFSDTKCPIIHGDWARVNDMGFKKINSKWKLSFLYLSYKTYTDLGINIEE